MFLFLHLPNVCKLDKLDVFSIFSVQTNNVLSLESSKMFALCKLFDLGYFYVSWQKVDFYHRHLTLRLRIGSPLY